MNRPSLEEFEALARRGTGRIPVAREFPADLETPVSAFLKLRGEGPAFLLESVEGGNNVGRYSFLGLGSDAQLRIEGGTAHLTGLGGGAFPLGAGFDCLDAIGRLLARNPVAAPGGIPPFFGGAVGYFAYDVVRQFERLPPRPPAQGDPPDAWFLLTDAMAVFDHVNRTMEIVVLSSLEGDAKRRYEDACRRIEEIAARLDRPLRPGVDGAAEPAPGGTEDLFPRDRFQAAVERAREYIRAGEIFQVVLSRRRTGRTSAAPFQVYRAMRRVNPSPYMFFLDCGPLQLIGSSPESLVKLAGGAASIRPIAGTRRRGATLAEDAARERELLADEKELAEHIMLVDLARNDLGRVCRYGTVRVTDLKAIERYSHVMHIVSNVEGELAPGKTGFDLVRASFPAGTVSGAPKIRAMEIIDELEPVRRGPYAGAVGYFGLGGNLDLCITIRTIWMQRGAYTMQAGAGIVADSDPEREYEETEAKMEALEAAVQLAEKGFR